MSKKKKRRKSNTSPTSPTIAPITVEKPITETPAKNATAERLDITWSLVLAGIIVIGFVTLGYLDSQNNMFANLGAWLIDILHVTL